MGVTGSKDFCGFFGGMEIFWVWGGWMGFFFGFCIWFGDSIIFFCLAVK